MPTHDEVLRAVQEAGDVELLDWVQAPGDYTLRRVDFEGLTGHRVFRVMPKSLSHPLAFYVAEGADGRAVVTSGHVAGVAELVRSEPGLLRGPGGAARLLELWCDTADACTLVEDGSSLTGVSADLSLQVLPALVEPAGTGWRVQMHVLDDAGQLQRWRLDVPAAGNATASRDTLATDVSRVRP
ncbi:MAG: hypothetical protein Q8P18_17140 [Pseudomonadota bacterium]|nr:hypothetical protein [Pseudomonadota bacterium]